MNHAIDYRHAPAAPAASPAAGRALYLSERDFMGAALPKPIEKVLPAAVMAPQDGPIDFSAELGLPYPATLPAMLAGTHAVGPGDSVPVGEAAGGVIVLILEGTGEFRAAGETVTVAAGDILAVPGSIGASAHGGDGLRFYYVDDSPMARYMGWQVQPTPRIAFTHWPAALLAAKLEETRAQGITASGVFLAHRGIEHEKLATPNLFAHLNRLAPGAANTVHGHAAAAITYVIEGNDASYSLLGETLRDGAIVDPLRVDWQPGQVSLTPPNLWHGHFNDGRTDILTLVVQLSGVYYNDRTMNFRFAG
jgi:gentisate 1,2-dioxygenase